MSNRMTPFFTPDLLDSRRPEAFERYTNAIVTAYVCQTGRPFAVEKVSTTVVRMFEAGLEVSAAVKMLSRLLSRTVTN